MRSDHVILDARIAKQEIRIRGLSGLRLSQLAGVSYPVVVRFVNGRPIRGDTFAKLARVLKEYRPVFGSSILVLMEPVNGHAGEALGQKKETVYA